MTEGGEETDKRFIVCVSGLTRESIVVQAAKDNGANISVHLDLDLIDNASSDQKMKWMKLKERSGGIFGSMNNCARDSGNSIGCEVGAKRHCWSASASETAP